MCDDFVNSLRYLDFNFAISNPVVKSQFAERDLRHVKTPSEKAKAEVAERMKAALANHPDPAVRRWRFREITRAVITASGVPMSEDTGRTWMEGSQPRDPRVAASLAGTLKVTAGWLYFGEPPIPEFARGPKMGKSGSRPSALGAEGKKGRGGA